ncbi:MAG: M48 family metallopeptidase [Thermodesulfobacteriota bacterium]
MRRSARLEFQGIYFDGRSSQAHDVLCIVGHDQVVIRSVAGEQIADLPLAKCILTPPLGSSRRFLKFPAGQRLQVDDPEILSFLDDLLRSHLGLQFVHLIESHWRLVAASMAGLVVCVWAFMAFAIPHLAKKVAMAAPAGLMNSISHDTLEFLDKRFFATSDLPMARQDEVKKIFTTLCDDFAPTQGCTLVFRQGGNIGANAFALPSGLVIVTDELIDFSENNEEIEGVLAHELVHVQARHGLRHVIQQAGVFMVISTLLGDMASLTSLGSALPMMLVESGYSRRFEEEADEHACLYFLERNRSVQPYKDMLYRLTKDKQLPAVASFLASHPDPDKRLLAIEELETNYGR